MYPVKNLNLCQFTQEASTHDPELILNAPSLIPISVEI
jgi:hypothetical protein